MKTLMINEKNIELHTALIHAGRTLEQMGLLEEAIKLAEAAIIMNSRWSDPTEEEQKEIEAIDRLLPLVVERIKARMEDAG